MSHAENRTHWVKRIKNGRDFYYRFSDYNEPVLIGNGDKKLSPKEIYQVLKDNPDWRYNSEMGFFWRDTDKNRYEKEAILLPDGAYLFLEEDYPESERLTPLEFRRDEYIPIEQFYLPIETEIKNVLKKREIYRSRGTQFKRGWLLFGKPGYGKTTMIRSLIQKTLPSNSIAFFLSSLPKYEFLQTLKEDNRLKIIVFEELASMLKYASSEKVDLLLNFLDGEFSFDDCLIFATTNYPEELPSNIVDRRSRFDRLVKVEGLNEASCKSLLKHYLQREPTPEEVLSVKDFAIPDIKEVCLISEINEITLEKAIQDIKDHKKIVEKNFQKSDSIGIHKRKWND